MPELRSARLRLHDGGRGTIEVDGQELHGVTAVVASAAVDERPQLVVQLLLQEIEIDGEMTVTIPDDTAEALAALGWTPPPTGTRQTPT